jgi:phosphoribosyl-ATP pyrophosphohydrolase/phosphoribosyl-AMP cyclohydrolase
MANEETIPSLRYDANGLIPAIVQDDENGEILMMAYMNADSLKMTIETGKTHFWSRSRKKFWMKGESSGHVQEVREILCDCDRDTLLVKVKQIGPGACHTGHRSCFFTTMGGVETSPAAFSANEAYKQLPVLDHLQAVIHDRRCNPKPDSYVAGLFARGRETIYKKVGEEAVETVIAAASGGRDATVRELADLMFHALVLMEHEGIALQEVYDVLSGRTCSLKKPAQPAKEEK